jgi:hypothetical protein
MNLSIASNNSPADDGCVQVQVQASALVEVDSDAASGSNSKRSVHSAAAEVFKFLDLSLYSFVCYFSFTYVICT